jgi:hypothetical protein
VWLDVDVRKDTQRHEEEEETNMINKEERESSL